MLKLRTACRNYKNTSKTANSSDSEDDPPQIIVTTALIHTPTTYKNNRLTKRPVPKEAIKSSNLNFDLITKCKVVNSGNKRPVSTKTLLNLNEVYNYQNDLSRIQTATCSKIQTDDVSKTINVIDDKKQTKGAVKKSHNIVVKAKNQINENNELGQILIIGETYGNGRTDAKNKRSNIEEDKTNLQKRENKPKATKVRSSSEINEAIERRKKIRRDKLSTVNEVQDNPKITNRKRNRKTLTNNPDDSRRITSTPQEVLVTSINNVDEEIHARKTCEHNNSTSSKQVRRNNKSITKRKCNKLNEIKSVKEKRKWSPSGNQSKRSEGEHVSYIYNPDDSHRMTSEQRKLYETFIAEFRDSCEGNAARKIDNYDTSFKYGTRKQKTKRNKNRNEFDTIMRKSVNYGYDSMDTDTSLIKLKSRKDDDNSRTPPVKRSRYSLIKNQVKELSPSKNASQKMATNKITRLRTEKKIKKLCVLSELSSPEIEKPKLINNQMTSQPSCTEQNYNKMNSDSLETGGALRIIDAIFKEVFNQRGPDLTTKEPQSVTNAISKQDLNEMTSIPVLTSVVNKIMKPASSIYSLFEQASTSKVTSSLATAELLKVFDTISEQDFRQASVLTALRNQKISISDTLSEHRSKTIGINSLCGSGVQSSKYDVGDPSLVAAKLLLSDLLHDNIYLFSILDNKKSKHFSESICSHILELLNWIVKGILHKNSGPIPSKLVQEYEVFLALETILEPFLSKKPTL